MHLVGHEIDPTFTEDPLATVHPVPRPRGLPGLSERLLGRTGTQVAQVVCVDCDKIFEISAPFMEWYGSTVSLKLGLKPISQRLQVSAQCIAFRERHACPNRTK